MLDIELFRKNLNQIIESEKKRFKNPLNAQKVLEYDEKWREVLQELQDLRNQRNSVSKEIGKLKKAGETQKFEAAKKKSIEIKDAIDNLEKKETEYLEEREKYRKVLPPLRNRARS